MAKRAKRLTRKMKAAGLVAVPKAKVRELALSAPVVSTGELAQAEARRQALARYRETARRIRAERLENDNYEYDDEIAEDPPLFKFSLCDLTDAQLEAETDRVCDRQGALVDAEHINESALARVEAQYRALRDERHRRQANATA